MPLEPSLTAGKLMWRSILLTAIVYAYGHPHFDGYRPGALDRPLQAFHTEVTEVAFAGHKVLERLDDARTMRAVMTYMEKIDSRLRGG